MNPRRLIHGIQRATNTLHVTGIRLGTGILRCTGRMCATGKRCGTGILPVILIAAIGLNSPQSCFAQLGEQTPCWQNSGPDHIVAGLTPTSWNAVGGIDAISLGMTECNVGTANLTYLANSNNHPVYTGNLYRYKIVGGASRLEQIGMSWAAHTFTALTMNQCCSCNGQGGTVLGAGCSDANTAGRGGSQCTTTGGLGPRFEINAHAGAITWPYTFRNDCDYIENTTVTRRLQYALDDVNASLNPGAFYYAEMQSITLDDAAAKHQDNNVSHFRVTFSSLPNPAVSAAGATLREQPAILSWQANDPGVVLTPFYTPELPNPGGDVTGFAVLGGRATRIGDGVWRYEYALYNMNSDRSFSGFTVFLPSGGNVSNAGFHDVFYHSGDGYNSSPENVVNFDGVDWPAVVVSNAVSWSLVPATPYENSNAVRWGTLYNFRFDCDVPPGDGQAQVQLFKPIVGLPDTVFVETVVPVVPCHAPGDINGDSVVNVDDIAPFVAHLLGTDNSMPCAADANQDGLVDGRDIAKWIGLM